MEGLVETTTTIEGQETLDQAAKGVKRKPESQMVYCSVCKISLNSSSQANAHYSGKSHQNRARFSFVTEKDEPSYSNTCTSLPINNPPPKQLVKCELCARTFNSESQLQVHITGKGHQLLVKSKLESTSPATAAAPTGSVDTTTVNHDPVGPSIPAGPPVMFGSNVTNVFHCAMCNITLNSHKQMEQHNKGLRHKIVIGKAKPPQVAGERWENVRYMKIANAVLGMNKDTITGSGGGMNLRQFYCEKCDLTVNSQAQLDQHLESQKHKMKQINNIQSKRLKRGGTGAVYGGRGGLYQPYKKVTQYRSAGYADAKPIIPPLSMNFVPSIKKFPGDGLYTEKHLNFMNHYGPEDFSQEWNSNFIYDMPPANIPMY